MLKKKTKKKVDGFYLKYGKRIFDLLICIPLLFLLLPFFLIIILVIKLDSPGPAIFKQERIGQHCKRFTIYKFRTMSFNAELVGPKYTMAKDNRITKVGNFLRKTSLDELPQLINVLLGDMSLVGFRPGVYENYAEEEFNSKKFLVKPGITGYAQVNGRSNITVEKKGFFEEKYVDDVSLKTDILIILKTVKVVLFSESIV